MVRFEDRIRVKINFDATDVAKAVAAAQLALKDIDEKEFNKSMERVDSRLAGLQERDPEFDIGGDIDRPSIESAKEEAEKAAEGVERIKIGGKVWNASIHAAVGNAKQKIQSSYEKQGKSRIQIGGEVDLSDLQTDLEQAEQASEEKRLHVPLRFNVHERSLIGALIYAHTLVESYEKLNSFTIPIEAEVDQGSFDDAVEFAGAKAQDALARAKTKAAEANKKLSKESVRTADAMGRERSEAAELAEQMSGSGMSNLAKAKSIAARANTRLASKADETHRYLRDELEVSEDVADQLIPLSKRSRFAGRSFRGLTERLDETTDSMRASRRVGDIFEDALGKLSVNVGAFTIALQNLATQIPIILGTISAIGSAALGAATAIITATFALVGMFAGGLIAQAEQMRDSIAGIETTAEALQEIFSRLKTLFRDALSPIIEVAGASDFFTRIIEGLAVIVNMMAQGVAMLTDEITSMLDALGDKGLKAFGETVAASVYAVQTLQDEFVDIMTGLFNATAAVIVFSAEFIDGFTESGSLTKSLGSLLGDLAKTVQNVFQGALPILNAFREILAGIVDILSRLEDSVFDSAISLAILLFLFNKVAGILSVVVSVLPALYAAFLVSQAQADGLGDEIIGLIRSFFGFVLASESVLGGVTRLSKGLNTLSADMSMLGMASLASVGHLELAERQLDDFAASLGMDLKKVQNLADKNNMDFTEALLFELKTPRFAEKLGREQKEAVDIVEAMGKKDPIDLAILRDEKAFEADTNLDKKFKNLVSRPIITSSKTARDALKTSAGATDSYSSKILKSYVKLVAGVVSSYASIAASAIAAVFPVTTLGSAVNFSIAPVLALAIAGGLLIGALTNLDKASGALGGSFQVLKDLLIGIGSFLLDIFIGTWNLIAGAIEGLIFIVEPIIDLFAGLAGTSDDSAASLSGLLALLDLVGAAFVFVFSVVGQVLRFIGLLGGVLMRVILIPLKLIVVLANAFIGLFYDAFNINTEDSPIIHTLKVLVELLRTAGDVVKFVGDLFVAFLNETIRGINTLLGVPFFATFMGPESIDDVEIGAGGGLATSREETVQEAQDAGGKLQEIGIPDFNFFGGDTITNNNIDADPDDKAALGRAVKRAIEKANSFERQRLGN